MNNRLKWLPMAGIMVVSTAMLASCSDQQSQQGQSQQPAAAVDVIEISPQKVQLSTALPGRTAAYRVALVRPQVSGVLLERKFDEGARVEQGQQLYQIDPAVYQANLASAQAEIERAEAVLKSSELRYQRFEELLTENAISQDEFDTAEATFFENKAALAVAKAQLKKARINLQYTQVKAPIDGIVGRSNFTVGALLTASQPEPLVTINQLDPIYVDISQSSKAFLQLKADVESGRIQANPQGNAPVSLNLNGLNYQQQGELLFSEVTVDEDTGSILLRAKFPNPDNNLYPGMFVRAKISEGSLDNALLVPQQAVTRDPRGRPYVMVVTSDNKVEQRMIVTERALASDWLISSGISSGDRVVTSGLQSIRPGDSVRIDNTTTEQQ
ncbi:MAG: efflux RND transporter periplasmic adaptor subunit [Pseudomonadota bacterium]